jgi:hypothetical protein
MNSPRLKAAVAGFALVALSACSTLTSNPGEARARHEMVCSAWKGAYQTLNTLDMGGRLSPDNVRQVEAVAPLFKAKCVPGAETPSEFTLDLLESQLLEMIAVKQGVKQ